MTLQRVYGNTSSLPWALDTVLFYARTFRQAFFHPKSYVFLRFYCYKLVQ